MALRWTAADMLEAAKGFRRLKAHKQLPVLRAALQHITQSTSPRNGLKRTLTPRSIIHGDAHFTYFNKIWGQTPDWQREVD